MFIILKHIPSKTIERDIKNFLMPTVNGGWFRKSGRIDSLVLYVQKNVSTSNIQRHVLVNIVPDFVAKRVVKELNGKTITGEYIAVCEYKIRSWHNDRRLTTRKLRNPLKDRRIAERRENYEKITR